MQSKTVRVLNAQQQKQVDKIFKCLATIAATYPDEPVILSRNKFVDSTIADLIDEVGDELVLLSAFAFWVDGRDLDGVLWPITQFQTSLVGAVAAAQKEIAEMTRHNTAFPSLPRYRCMPVEAAQAALAKFGGAR